MVPALGVFLGDSGCVLGDSRCPMGPCTQIVYTLAPKYLYRDYIKANVSTIWVHGPLGVESFEV